MKKIIRVFLIVFLVLFLLVLLITCSSGKEKSDATGDAASKADISSQITDTGKEAKNEADSSEEKPDAKTETKQEPASEPEPEAVPEPEPALQEINPEIPLGTEYLLSQGEYECGDDIPAGRYLVEWVSGNQFGGYLEAKSSAEYLPDMASIDPDTSFVCLLSEGDCFELTLSTYRFSKISSLPNDMFLQPDGSYLLGQGYYFEGIDIPEGKYNVTAVGGNQFGIYLSTNTKSLLSLSQGETYNNLKLKDEGAQISVSLGTARFQPAG